MNISVIKSNLQAFYNNEAEFRNQSEKEPWKINVRNQFLRSILDENKRTLLEIGAGTGQDSLFFMENGLQVTAIDLSPAMVAKCREKGIDAYQMDVYDIKLHEVFGDEKFPMEMNHCQKTEDPTKKGFPLKIFDCVWSLNCLLHVPKTDLPEVLRGVDSVLSENGLFFFGVYGGNDIENEWSRESSDIPRFFSFYTDEPLQNILRNIFDIERFESFKTGRGDDFQYAFLRKKRGRVS